MLGAKATPRQSTCPKVTHSWSPQCDKNPKTTQQGWEGWEETQDRQAEGGRIRGLPHSLLFGEERLHGAGLVSCFKTGDSGWDHDVVILYWNLVYWHLLCQTFALTSATSSSKDQGLHPEEQREDVASLKSSAAICLVCAAFEILGGLMIYIFGKWWFVMT